MVKHKLRSGLNSGRAKVLELDLCFLHVLSATSILSKNSHVLDAKPQLIPAQIGQKPTQIRLKIE